MQAIDLLRPAFLLAGWTLLITTWMFVTRVPAMAKLKIDPQDAADTSKLSDLLPPEVQRVANNYEGSVPGGFYGPRLRWFDIRRRTARTSDGRPRSPTPSR